MSRMIAFAAASLLVMSHAGKPADAAAESVVLQLHGPAQFEFAGYYAALWQGYYSDAGLAVEIRPVSAPGQTPVDPVQEVTGERAQFGTGGTELLVRAAQGLPLLLLAPIFQHSGVSIYYRADDDFPSPAALFKAKVGRLPASDPLDVELVTALRGDGLDPARLKSVSLAPGQAVPALADRLIDAAPGSAWDLPWQARARKLALKSFNPADYRVEFYGDTLFTMQRYARAHPALVERFRAASLKGWAYALDHADEIAQRMARELPPPVPEPALFARYQAEVARRLARYPEVPLGHSSVARWTRIEASLASAGAVLRTADPVSFLYDPQAEAQRGGEWRQLVALAGLAGIIAVLVAFALVRIGRRQGRRAAQTTVAAAMPLLPAPRAADTPAAPAPTSEAVASPANLAPVPDTSPAPVASVATPPEEPPLPPEPPAPADLNAMLTALEPAIRARVPAPINVRLSLLPDAWRCTVDRDTVASLVLELVGDANRDMKAGDDLIVGTRNYAFNADTVGDTPGAQIGEYTRITVRDSGRGIAPSALERIFDPTVTVRPAASVAWLLTRRLGGFTRVESAEGIGTAIHLYFPRAAEPAPTPAEGTPPAPAQPRRRYRSSGARLTHRRSRSLS